MVNHSEALDVLGDAVLVEEVLDDFNVGVFGVLFAFALVGSPGSPLGFGFHLDGPGLFVVAVAGSCLLVETVEGEFFIVGDFLDSGFFS